MKSHWKLKSFRETSLDKSIKENNMPSTKKRKLLKMENKRGKCKQKKIEFPDFSSLFVKWKINERTKIESQISILEIFSSFIALSTSPTLSLPLIFVYNSLNCNSPSFSATYLNSNFAKGLSVDFTSHHWWKFAMILLILKSQSREIYSKAHKLITFH